MPIDQYALLSSAVIQKKDKKVLLLKRSNKNKTYKGYWQLPEGKIRPDEKPSVALARELQEEIGCKISNIALKYILPIQVRVQGINFLLIKAVFTAKRSSKLRISADHSRYGWFTPKKALQSLRLVPGTKEILQRI